MNNILFYYVLFYWISLGAFKFPDRDDRDDRKVDFGIATYWLAYPLWITIWLIPPLERAITNLISSDGYKD